MKILKCFVKIEFCSDFDQFKWLDELNDGLIHWYVMFQLDNSKMLNSKNDEWCVRIDA